MAPPLLYAIIKIFPYFFWFVPYNSKNKGE